MTTFLTTFLQGALCFYPSFLDTCGGLHAQHVLLPAAGSDNRGVKNEGSLAGSNLWRCPVV
jgi:hypothetical protein